MWRTVSAGFWVCLVVVGGPGCGAEPYQLEAIDLQGVPVDEGALAGTFAVKAVAATLVHLPVPGIEDVMGGGVHLGLIHRRWDAAAGLYRQRTQLCGGYNYEVHGTRVFPDDATYRAVPESVDEVVEIDHATGQYTGRGHVQLWALRDLPDPATSPLPDSLDAASQAPHRDRIYDMDGDGQPGYTTHVEGLANGDAYTILRKRVRFDGVTASADRVLGLDDTDYESLLLGSSTSMVDGLFAGEAEKYPDPARSWFEEVRVEETCDCDVVMGLQAQGVLSTGRPF